MIPFSIPTTLGTEIKTVRKSLENKSLSGHGFYSSLCEKKISELFDKKKKVFMTPSCTDALEASSIILNLRAGDEVIMPSFTFVTTATSFAIRGIQIRFVDIDKRTLNIDPEKIEEAITDKTRAIVCVHYAGVACDMEKIEKIAKKNGLWLIEDAAQCMFSYYKGKHLGGIGDIGAFSYHDTKNIHCGEGGSLVVNREDLFEKSHTVIDKGTNRRQFLDGNCEKYTWVDLGSSYVMSDLNAAFLINQIESGISITKKRKSLWERYYKNLEGHEDKFDLPFIPSDCNHNAHIFRISIKDTSKRSELMKFLGSNGINSTFHFVPLHSAPAGRSFGKFIGKDINTTIESQKIVRLPIFDSLKEDQVDFISEKVLEFYK